MSILKYILKKKINRQVVENIITSKIIKFGSNSYSKTCQLKTSVTVSGGRISKL